MALGASRIRARDDFRRRIVTRNSPRGLDWQRQTRREGPEEQGQATAPETAEIRSSALWATLGFLVAATLGFWVLWNWREVFPFLD